MSLDLNCFLCKMLTYCFAKRVEQTAPNYVKASLRRTSLIWVTNIHRDHCLMKEQSGFDQRYSATFQSDFDIDIDNANRL